MLFIVILIVLELNGLSESLELLFLLSVFLYFRGINSLIALTLMNNNSIETIHLTEIKWFNIILRLLHFLGEVDLLDKVIHVGRSIILTFVVIRIDLVGLVETFDGTMIGRVFF